MSPQKKVRGCGQWARPESWRPWPTATDATFFHAGLAKLPGLLGVAVQSGVRWRRAAESAFRTPSASRSVVYNWCSGLLPPGVIQSAGIDGIETEFVDKLQDDGFGLCIVARNGQGSSTRRSTRPTAFEQMARIDAAMERPLVTPRSTTAVPRTTWSPTSTRSGLVQPSRRMASLEIRYKKVKR